MPRSAPAATVWMPSATKKVAPTISSVAVSSMTAPPLSTASPKKNRAIANRREDHGQRQRCDQNAMPSSVATKPARLTAAASLRPTACPTRTVAAMPMPNGTMNRIAVTCSAI